MLPKGTKHFISIGILLGVLLLINQSFAAKRRVISTSKLPGSSRVSTTTNNNNSKYKVVCYYTNWSQYRPKAGKFMPEDIEPHLCTHVIFAFGWLKKGKLTSFESNDETKDGKKGLYDRMMELKNKNPNLKVLLAIGGWSFGTEKFKEMSGSRYSRQTFILDSINYLRHRKFDGLDLDWEYPKGEDDKKNFVALVKELDEAFGAESKETKKVKLLLTAAVPAGPDSIRAGYDVPEVSKYLDFINLMSYDFHGKWESTTGHNSPLYAPSSDTAWRKQLSMEHAASLWVQLGAPKEKIIIGTGTYGRSFQLSNPDKHGVNAPAKGGGKAGVYTREAGFLAYYEICEILKNGATYVWDEEMKAPYAYFDNDQWVGFDDERSIRLKMHWIKEKGYGGAMVWTVDMDDFHGSSCGNGRYPLISLMKEELNGIKRSQGSAIMDWSKLKTTQKVDLDIAPFTYPVTTEKPAPIVPVSQEVKIVKQAESPPKIMCYFTTWSIKRSGQGKFSPEKVNYTLCTHIVVAFATMRDGRLAAPSEKDVELYAKIVELKKQSESLKVLLALGGWNFGSKPFREMTETMFKRNSFVYDAVEFLRTHNFDGIDIDWEYPRGEEEKDKYTQLLKELKEAFEGEAKTNKVTRLILSAAVPANSEVIQAGYDVAEISKTLDIINIMTYDFHGLWENHVGHNSPLKPMSMAGNYDSKLTTEFSAEEWVKLGAPKDKIMIGLAMYGRTFTLEDTSKFDIGSPAIGGGAPGKYTKEPGILAFYEVCDFLRDNATLVWDTEQLVPFAYKGEQWVGFDDERSIKGKIDWLKKNEYGGILIWSMDLDDFSGHCGGPGYPLLTMAHKELQGYGVPGGVISPELNSLNAKSATPVDPNEIVCKEADGFISYHRDVADCTMYYMCEGERRHHMPCPTNLVFNVNENVCDWPENVDGCATHVKAT